MRLGLILYLIFHCCLPVGLAQNDSLYSVWKNENNSDSLRLDAYKIYIWNEYMFTDPDSALILSNELYDYAVKKKQYFFYGSALNHQAVALSILGKNESALSTYFKSVDACLRHGFESKAAPTYSNIAGIYQEKGDFKNAAKYYFKALNIFEKDDNKRNIAIVYSNLGVLYNIQKIYDQALKFYNRALEIRKKLDNNDFDIGQSYLNLGAVYGDMKDYDKAIIFYNKSLNYLEKVNSLVGIGTYYLNMGHVTFEKGDSVNSLDYYLKALEYYDQIGDVRQGTIAEISIGSNYVALGERTLALMYLEDAFERSKNLELNQQIATGALNLYELYKSEKNYNKALEYLEIYGALNDSLNSVNSKESTIMLKFEYEYDKKALIDSLAYVSSQELNIVEIREQKAALAKAKTQRYALFGGIALMLIFGLFILRSYRRKKQDHDTITSQHHLLSESHREIKQSIEYAKRLQDAILPTQQTLSLYFKNYFVLFKPKDVVSGDFYWFEYDSKTDTRIFAVADCTGHGVPGAMVSLVCATALNRCVNELGLTQPAEILNKTRELIIETFSKRVQHLRDGMDITICTIDKHNICTVAGANNALWIVKKDNQKELIEYRVDKQTVGWTENLIPFTQKQIHLKKGDLIYLQTDGFIDQFGGENNKKFKRAPLKKLIPTLVNKSMDEQKKSLNKAYDNWRGDHEQIDDVCLMGIEI